jgi:hypothetical protein
VTPEHQRFDGHEKQDRVGEAPAGKPGLHRGD